MNQMGDDAIPCEDMLLLSVGSASDPIIATAVRLHPRAMVDRWHMLRAEAQQQFSSVSSGLGFFGSPSWVLGASLVVGALESLATKQKAEAGRVTLAEAETLFDDLRRAERSFPLGEIINLDVADPNFWRSEFQSESFRTLGEDFIALDLRSGGRMIVRWSAVSTYQAILNGCDAMPPIKPTLSSSLLDEASHFLG